MAVQTPFFPPLELGGELFEFTHLEPFQMVVPSERARKDLQVHVRYTNHSFSRGLYDGESVDEEDVFPDQHGKPRKFCPDRFELSLDLPEYIADLNNPKAKVKQTAAERNWVYVVQLDSPKGPYYVFFEIKVAPKNTPDDLHMIVESGYQLTEGFDKPQTRGRISFQLLCGKVYRREQIFTK
jgi:hypothetical protein